MNQYRIRNFSLFIAYLLFLTSRTISASAQSQTSSQPKVDTPALMQPKPEVQALLNQGIQAYRANNVQGSFALFSSAERNAKALRDVPGEAGALELEGFVLCDSSKSDSPQWQAGIEKLKDARVLAHDANLVDSELHILDNLGTAYLNAYNRPEAKRWFEQLITLSSKHNKFSAQASALKSLGNICFQQNDWKAALKNFKAARKWAGQAVKLKEDVNEAIEVEISALNNMGRTYQAMDRPNESVVSFNTALSQAEDFRDWRNEAIARNNLAKYYQAIFLPRIALQKIEKFADSGPSSAAEKLIANGDNDTLVDAKNRLGQLYLDIGDTADSSKQYHQSLNILANMDFAGAEADAWNGIAVIHLIGGDFKNAKAALEKAQPFAMKAGGASFLSTSLEQGILELKTRDLSTALGKFKQCQGMAHSLAEEGTEAFCLASIGAIEYRQIKMSFAQRDLKLGLLGLEAVRASHGAIVESKSNFLEDTADFYRTYIQLLLQRGETKDAFAWIEKIKARTLYDVMSLGTMRTKSHVSSEQQQKEREGVNKIQNLSRELDAEEVKQSPNLPKLRELNNQLEAAHVELKILEGAISPQKIAATQKVVSQLATVDTIASFLPSDTAFVQYVTLRAPGGTDRVAMVCVTQVQGHAVVKAYNIQVPMPELEGLIETLRTDCISLLAYEEPARQLYRLLIAPAAGQLAGKRRLILCPEGILWQLPFQTLLVSSGRTGHGNVQGQEGSKHFLLEQYQLTYALSATTLQAALQSHRATKNKLPQPSLLAVVNPSSPTGSLEDTEIPLIRLRKLVPGMKVLRGREANRSTVTALASHYRYIHFGSHGLFDGNFPMESYLQLASNTSRGHSDSGRLTAQEICDLKLNADLVMLAACDSGRGLNRAGEGLVGMTWALFMAGSPSQIVSQWKITSQSTAEFTTNFYEHLFKGEHKDKALQSAAVSMLHKKHLHPYYWAPFVLVGDWE